MKCVIVKTDYGTELAIVLANVVSVELQEKDWATVKFVGDKDNVISVTMEAGKKIIGAMSLA